MRLLQKLSSVTSTVMAERYLCNIDLVGVDIHMEGFDMCCIEIQVPLKLPLCVVL